MAAAAFRTTISSNISYKGKGRPEQGAVPIFTGLFLHLFNGKDQKIWNKNFGGIKYEFVDAIALGADNRIYVTGYTESNNSGDVGAALGNGDGWFIKIKDF